ncbi:MAG: hypothetical protein BWY26_00522 [Elusimicrobia bacterium ADurb.Bin231]|nr:MAG: hypothetical protein BWY26_00522 [Elusimicrobia bacterium ADurb.Bin231]
MDCQEIILETAETLLSRITYFIPFVIGFFAILIFGWILAVLVRKLLVKLLVLLKADIFSGKSGLSGVLAKAGVRYTFSEILAGFFYWVIILIFFTAALNLIGITVVGTVLDRILLYIPNIVIAVFILVVGTFLSSFLSGVVSAACVGAGISRANTLSSIVSVIVMVLAVIIALEQLNIATDLINAVVITIFASIGLAFAISFGLGSQEFARKAISDFADMFKKK